MAHSVVFSSTTSVNKIIYSALALFTDTFSAACVDVVMKDSVFIVAGQVWSLFSLANNIEFGA
jgi:hypothetical protein